MLYWTCQSDHYCINEIKLKKYLTVVIRISIKEFLITAGVAQSVEQLICNQHVGGSIPLASLVLR